MEGECIYVCIHVCGLRSLSLNRMHSECVKNICTQDHTWIIIVCGMRQEGVVCMCAYAGVEEYEFLYMHRA
jgi:hypothetical protein